MTLKDVENIIAWLNCQIEKARRGDLPMEAVALYGDVLALVKNLPTIKADPVRHGKLVEGLHPNDSRCSVCNQVFRDEITFIYPFYDGGVFRIPKKCPECGAYWNGGAEYDKR